jgi:hypothetical protein
MGSTNLSVGESSHFQRHVKADRRVVLPDIIPRDAKRWVDKKSVGP